MFQGLGGADDEEVVMVWREPVPQGQQGLMVVSHARPGESFADVTPRRLLLQDGSLPDASSILLQQWFGDLVVYFSQGRSETIPMVGVYPLESL